MSGPRGDTFFLDTTGAGAWIPGPTRDGALRDYAPSVMYESGKVLYAGGGLDQNTHLPTNLDGNHRPQRSQSAMEANRSNALRAASAQRDGAS